MRSVISFFVLALTVTAASAQISVTSNLNSLLTTSSSFLPVSGVVPMAGTRNVDLKEGSPFFQDKWSQGRLITEDRNVYQNILLRLNLMDNRVHYQDSAGKEMVLNLPIREVQLQQTSSGTAHFINGNMLPASRPGWFQLLVNDTLTLLKGFTKQFEEHTSYGSATEYSIKTQESYIVFVKDQEFRVNRPSDFVKILPAKKAQIEQEIKRMNSKLKRDEQLTFIATFCNTLLKNPSSNAALPLR